MVSIGDMDKFEQKEIKKIKGIRTTWYEWLINYIPEPISLFKKAHLNKLCMGEERN